MMEPNNYIWYKFLDIHVKKINNIHSTFGSKQSFNNNYLDYILYLRYNCLFYGST